MAYNLEDTARLKDSQLVAQKVAEKLTVVNTRLQTLEDANGETNVIESVKVNGTALTVTDKAVDVTVPTKVSDLDNDSKFQTQSEVETAVAKAISESGHASYKTVDAVPSAADAEDNVLYLVMNTTTNHYDIYAKVNGSAGAEVVLLDDTTVDLSNYVEKETGKGLSTNDFTDEDKSKLNSLAEESTKVTASTTNGNIVINGTETTVYTHPSHTAYESGLYKVTVDALGHVVSAVAVTHTDLEPLMNYTTDEETKEMLADVFGS